ncbi:hypothetical protein ACP70R_000786 [Stipagrostis hirtigluma subsp. patula]
MSRRALPPSRHLSSAHLLSPKPPLLCPAHRTIRPPRLTAPMEATAAAAVPRFAAACRAAPRLQASRTLPLPRRALSVSSVAVAPAAAARPLLITRHTAAVGDKAETAAAQEAVPIEKSQVPSLPERHGHQLLGLLDFAT